MTDVPSRDNAALRNGVAELCARFGDDYWRRCDQERAYPEEFVRALTEAKYLSALIPADYGGLGFGLTEATVILETINRSGGSSSACHAQIYTMGALLRHGSDEQKRRYLPDLATGKLRLQAFSVTEPAAGSNTTAIITFAERTNDGYLVTGHKNWTSRIVESDLLLLLARTRPRSEGPSERTKGLSLFLVDLREVREQQPETLVVEPVRTMFNYATYQVWFKRMHVPTEGIVGQEGEGFDYIIDGWNAERILLASEAIGDGYWFIDRAVEYANRRSVFDSSIGAYQGIQFPIARAYTDVVAADQMRERAAALFDAEVACGPEANMAKLLASEASWQAANVCLDTHGGYGFVDKYDIERKFRETRMFQVAPVSNNMVLAYIGQHVLGLPKSY